jgi:anaerobic selenocysteine-containing dehydrogenase
LPASSQFEKAEATFVNFEFPKNVFHLRRRLFAPAANTLPEAEIHARLCEALGVVGEADYAPLRAARTRDDYIGTFLMKVMPDPRLSGLAPVLLYRTLALPDELREGAVVLGLVLKAALEHGAALARAGFTGTPMQAASKLFDAILDSPSGVVFAIDEWGPPKRKLHLRLPDLLEELAHTLASAPPARDAEFPFVLTAGERRSFTANTIIRDLEWRKKDADGALRIHPDDAAALGVIDGGKLRLVTRRGSAEVSIEVTDTMQRGHVALPNGQGVPNELTDSTLRDRFVGTPWHKHVPARLEAV